MANELHLDDVMVLDVLQDFIEFIGAPKMEWLHYTPPSQPVEAVQMVADTPKEVLIERQPYEESLPFPRTEAKHIRAQLLVEQTEKEKGKETLKEPEEEVNNEVPTYEAMEEE
jgi:hypothetical protein